MATATQWIHKGQALNNACLCFIHTITIYALVQLVPDAQSTAVYVLQAVTNYSHMRQNPDTTAQFATNSWGTRTEKVACIVYFLCCVVLNVHNTVPTARFSPVHH
jgi:hypothetical protein